LAASGLEVSPQVLPQIDAALVMACRNLELARQDVSAFVLPSPEIQAACYVSGAESCTLSITSGLVQLLTGPSELAFVLGHELGHFLLGHSGYEDSPAGLREGRAQEVSADRIGLLAAEEVSAALRAVLKTVSGLGDEHLRHDVGSFMGSTLARTEGLDETHSTHPNMAFRARCLLRFDAHRRNFSGLEAMLEDTEAFARFDQEVLNDVERLVEGPLIARMEEARSKLLRWAWTLAALTDGALTRPEQEALREHCGEEFCERLISILQGESAASAVGLARERLVAAVMALEQLEPEGAAIALKGIARAIREDGRIDGRPDDLFEQLLSGAD